MRMELRTDPRSLLGTSDTKYFIPTIPGITKNVIMHKIKKSIKTILNWEIRFD